MPVAKRKALVAVFTGNGKGKTTAALGILLRSWGRYFKLVMLSFIKSETSNYGEERAARKLGIEMIPLGGGFTWLSKDLEKDKALARKCWALCREKIDSGEYDVVILDEINVVMKLGYLDPQLVVDFLKTRDPRQHVVLTGRGAPPAIVEAADLVSEIMPIKHPYRSGIKAQQGIEF